MTQQTESGVYADLALTAFLEGLVQGRRLLWIGDASSGAPERLAKVASKVRVLASGDLPEEDGETIQWSRFRDGELIFSPESYDIAVVPDLGILEEPGRRVEELSEIVGSGAVLLGSPVQGDLDAAYRALDDALGDHFRDVRMLGQAPFAAFALADFDAEDPGRVLVDASLADPEDVSRYLALASRKANDIEPYYVVQVPEIPGAAAAVAAPDPELEEALVQSRRAEDKVRRRLDRAQARVSRLEEKLDRARQQLAEAQEQPAAPALSEDAQAEVARLEGQLRERGARVRELEAEVARRGRLVRDVTEELREHHLGRRGDASPQALDAEAAEVAARFEADELRGHLLEATESLASLEAESKELRALSGDAKGRIDAAEAKADDALRQAKKAQGDADSAAAKAERAERDARKARARFAELEELRDTAEARVRLLQDEAVVAQEKERSLEAEAGKLREDLELALIKARKAAEEPTVEPARLAELEASEQRLSERVSVLSGQLMAAQDLLRDLEAQRSSAPVTDAVEAAKVKALEAELEAAKAKLDAERERFRDESLALTSQLQAPAIDESEVARLRGELEGLRMRAADLQASQGAKPSGDDGALKAELAKAEVAQAELTRSLAESEQARQSAAERAGELEGSLAARDALVSRLQRDLAEQEGESRRGTEQVEAMGEENRRLRTALLDASGAVAEKEAAEARAEALQNELTRTLTEAGAVEAERERVAALEEELDRTRKLLDARSDAHAQSTAALKELRQVLDGLRLESEGEMGPRSTITAAGMEAPRSVEQELADKDTLLRSLTAQLEERDDRLRAMERRLGDSGSVGDEGEQDLLELEERVARLQEELEHERVARGDAERELSELSKRGPAADELQRFEEELRQRERALEDASSRAGALERDVASLRSVCAETREGIEELLGSATASGDPATAERLGSLLSVLSRF